MKIYNIKQNEFTQILLSMITLLPNKQLKEMKKSI